MRLLAPLTALLVTTVLAGAGALPARAQPAATAPRPPSATAWDPAPVPAPTRTRRYGLTVAAVDAACMGTAFLGAIILVGEALGDDGGGSDADLGAVMLFGGAAGMFVGAPLVHRSQGNVKGAWRSLGLRLGLPLAGSLIGAAIDRGRAQSGVVTSEHTAGNLGAAGMIAALVIDWTVLAEVTEPLPVAPYVAPVRGGGYAVGLSTTF